MSFLLFTHDLVEGLCAHGYHIIDNFLPEKHVQQLRTLAKELHQQGSFQHAKIGRAIQTQHNINIRSDEIYWLDKRQEQEAITHYLNVMHEMLHALNHALFLSLQEFEAHFAIYQPGSFYKKHVDQFQTTKNRKISCFLKRIHLVSLIHWSKQSSLCLLPPLKLKLLVVFRFDFINSFWQNNHEVECARVFIQPAML